MGQRISGPGVGLQGAQYLYPSEINPANTPLDVGSAYTSLAPGDTMAIPAGTYYVDPGKAGVIQFLDPVTGVWRLTSAQKAGPQYVISDGFNYRVANLTGCPVVAVVTAGGSGYTSTPTVTANGTGGSTWRAIVGGMVSVSTIAAAGSGYGMPPLVFIEAPPVGGVQATGYATITGGSVTSVTLSNVGAGYVTAPRAVVVTNPSDPALAAGTEITPATITLAIVGSGVVSAIVCTNPGASVSAAPTLTVSGGGGSSAAATALRLGTFTAASALNASGYTGGGLLTTGGPVAPPVPAYVNPEIQGLAFVPRPAQATLSGAGGSLTSVSAIYDGGLTLGTPVVSVTGAPTGVYAGGTLSFDGAPTTVLLQPAP